MILCMYRTVCNVHACIADSVVQCALQVDQLYYVCTYVRTVCYCHCIHMVYRNCMLCYVHTYSVVFREMLRQRAAYLLSESAGSTLCRGSIGCFVFRGCHFHFAPIVWLHVTNVYYIYGEYVCVCACMRACVCACVCACACAY